MFGRMINQFLNKYDRWQLIQAALAVGIVLSTVALGLELTLPVRLVDNNPLIGYRAVAAVNDVNVAQVLQPESKELEITGKINRSGLFKMESAISDKPMADKTIEMIRSRLKLRCIMELNGEPVAYVYIEGEGLQRCQVGDSVKDLFTVLGINEKTIEISIVGHKQILSL